MAGRRRTGSFSGTLSTLVLRDRQHRIAQEDERTKFNQRLQALGIAQGIKTGQITPSFQGGQLTGFQQTQLAPSEGMLGNDTLQQILDAGGQVEHTIKHGNTTIHIRRGGKLAQPRPPSETEANRINLGAQPATPYPAVSGLQDFAKLGRPPIVRMTGGLPITPGGRQLLQNLITHGFTESPAASVVAQPVPPNRWQQLGEGFTRFGASLLPQLHFGMAAPSATSSNQEVDDLAALVRAGKLRTKQQARSLIQQAGLNPDDPSFRDILNSFP